MYSLLFSFLFFLAFIPSNETYKPYDCYKHDSWVAVFCFLFFKNLWHYLLSSWLQGLSRNSWRSFQLMMCLDSDGKENAWKHSDKREHNVMSVGEVMKNNERTALHGRQQCARNNRKEGGSAGSKSSHASIRIQKTCKSAATCAGCRWNTLFAAGATYCTHMLQPLWNTGQLLQIHSARIFMLYMALWNQALFPFFLESAFSVSHQNERLRWGFHHSEAVQEWLDYEVCVALSRI